MLIAILIGGPTVVIAILWVIRGADYHTNKRAWWSATAIAALCWPVTGLGAFIAVCDNVNNT